jgi:thioredoxin 1
MIEVMDDKIDEGTLAKGKSLMVFKSPTCGPCKIMSPIFESLKYPNMPIYMVDTSKNPQIASRFNIGSVPCMIILENGEIMDMKVGAVPKRQLEDWITENL